jgi:hypothetical protein
VTDLGSRGHHCGRGRGSARRRRAGHRETQDTLVPEGQRGDSLATRGSADSSEMVVERCPSERPPVGASLLYARPARRPSPQTATNGMVLVKMAPPLRRHRAAARQAPGTILAGGDAVLRYHGRGEASTEGTSNHPTRRRDAHRRFGEQADIARSAAPRLANLRFWSPRRHVHSSPSASIASLYASIFRAFHSHASAAVQPLCSPFCSQACRGVSCPFIGALVRSVVSAMRRAPAYGKESSLLPQNLGVLLGDVKVQIAHARTVCYTALAAGRWVLPEGSRWVGITAPRHFVSPAERPALATANQGGEGSVGGHPKRRYARSLCPDAESG